MASRSRFLKIVASVLFLVGPLTVLMAETIGDITIVGLQRTRESVIFGLLPATVGDPFTATTVEEFETELVNSELFADVAVTAAPAPDGTVAIEITIDERWTLVPVPFAASDGTTVTGGLVLIETNLFGRNKQLVSAAIIGGSGFSGFLAFVDPAVFGSRWTTTVSAATGLNEEIRTRPDGTLVHSYQVNEQSGGASVGYRFTPDLTVAAGMRYAQWRIETQEPGLDAETVPDGTSWEPRLTVEYDGTRIIDVLRYGPMVQGAARYVTFASGWETQAEASLALRVPSLGRLRIIGNGGIGDIHTVAETPISARDGFRTVPYQQVSADRWVSGTTFLDLPIVSRPWGALVLSHFWEAGIYGTEGVASQPFYGPGLGFRVYVRQIAIPALGIDVGWNLREATPIFSFAVGARM